MKDTTWFDAAEEKETEVIYQDYPLYAATMAVAEQQKRTADALERIIMLLEHCAIKYLGARVRPDTKETE